MLRKIRIALAALFFICITLLFIGIGHDWWGWMAKLQFLPSTMRLIGGATLGNIAVAGGILLVTFLAGRIYCSVICPLGVMQDVIIWLRRRLGKRFPKWKAVRKRFSWSKERRWVRYPVLALVIAAVIFDLQVVVALLGPYSTYGRIVRSIVGGGPAPLLIAAGVTFVLVVLCAWLWGRVWCNVICPVGTLLGSVSRYQLFGVRVDESKCVKCGLCARNCKSSCIDSASGTIDHSRCVDCFDCIGNCAKKAISFGRIKTKAASGVTDAGVVSQNHGRPWPCERGGPANEVQRGGRSEAKVLGDNPSVVQPEAVAKSGDVGRRQFIATGALLVGTGIAAGAQNMKLDGGLAPITPKEAHEREPRLVPPGAGSANSFYDHCTACQLCVAACPNKVLRPSTDLDHLLQPQMGYEKGYCRPECTACSHVCPAGAIRPVTREEKAAIHIGTASVNPELCLAASGQERCTTCARHCPTGAIIMVDTDKYRRPTIAEEECIGCGNCEYVCPVRPVSAITVKGRQTHIIR
ncbi:MAG: 4Fe-4S dicluster domain-containing protein [Bacteroidales bacterium]|nr:4Fe-4S dicluster domain-containing protein [Bacteroidales bacterium]